MRHLIRLPDDVLVHFMRAKEIMKDYNLNVIHFNNSYYQNESFKEKIIKKYDISELDYILTKECIRYIEYTNNFTLAPPDSKINNKVINEIYKSEAGNIYNHIMDRAGYNKDIINILLKEYNIDYILKESHMIIMLIRIYINEYINEKQLFKYVSDLDTEYYSMSLDQIIWALKEYISTLRNESIFDNMNLVEQAYQNELNCLNEKYQK